MKDQVFNGRDVAAAVQQASRTLGLPTEGLKYVVVDAGQAAAPGVPERPAQIAVLMKPQAPAPATPPPPSGPRVPPPASPGDPAARIRQIVRSLAEAAQVDLAAEVDESPETVTVRLEGPGRDLLLEDGGEPLQALEHLIQRIFGRVLAPRRLIVACEGYRDVRAEALQSRATEIARAVMEDGRPRSTEALNSYERRLVHVALSEHPRVRTFSVGEGADRRVTIALREAGAPPAGEPGG